MKRKSINKKKNGGILHIFGMKQELYIPHVYEIYARQIQQVAKLREFQSCFRELQNAWFHQQLEREKDDKSQVFVLKSDFKTKKEKVIYVMRQMCKGLKTTPRQPFQ